MPLGNRCVTTCRDPTRGKDPVCPVEQGCALPEHTGREAGN